VRVDDRFELVAARAKTGNAIIWRGRDTSYTSQHMVTIVQHPRSRDTDSQGARRREVQLCSTIVADCWAGVLGFGVWNDVTYVVLEDVPGEPVDDLILSAHARGQNMATSLIVSISTQVLEALELTSKAGIVHGDICSGSVFCYNGTVKVLCVGLARAHHTAPIDAPLPHMSPDQVRGQRLDNATDLWGLGVLIYRMACGKYPFAPSTSSEMTLRDAILEQPLLDLPSLPPQIASVIPRALERNPQHRYRSAQEMRRDLMPSGSDATRTHTTYQRPTQLPLSADIYSAHNTLASPRVLTNNNTSTYPPLPPRPSPRSSNSPFQSDSRTSATASSKASYTNSFRPHTLVA